MLPAPPPAVVEEIAAFGRYAASRGWVPATAGNFSRRVDARHAAVTRSGVDKGDLRAEDLAVLALDEPIPAGMSAETPLHLARYRTDPAVGAVFHVHTVAATVLSRLDERAGFVRTEGFEMHKSLSGFATHESVLDIPVFRNRPGHRRAGRGDRGPPRARRPRCPPTCSPATGSTPGARPPPTPAGTSKGSSSC